MMRRKFFSVARNEAAAQRWTMAASRQRHTRRVRMRTPDCGLSIKLVVARQRCSDRGMPKRLMVKHSSNPSRKLFAAAGHSRSGTGAFYSIFVHRLARLFNASFRPRLAAVALASSLGLHLHQVGQRTFTSKLLSMPSTQRSRWRGGRCRVGEVGSRGS
jgi:hypothetical protein